MAKLEELSELLVSEIRNFEMAVKKLEEIQKKKITIDISEFKKAMSDHKLLMENQNSTTKRTVDHFENLMKDGNINPKWAVIVFIVSLALNCIGVMIILFL
ncbi:hypothetical protein FK178_02820 [Antarcticibacterium arcticum]|uniref:Uncharacterized protein n=1 Tax=Antarcticibacterium arcticum TaxID=2585771 RepID=A0A5B8YGI9_9FLAO|nr:DUF6730 family protein [Antarcticibacterium arcticum]QED36711.1 hypothetical protein FK178_02820 [Antarcticibacterium arcticum]